MIVSLVKMNSPNMERTIVEGAQSAGTVVEKVDGLSKDSLRATVAAGRGAPRVASPTELAALQRQSQLLEKATPEEIIAWAVQAYFPNLTMATAFGPEGCVILFDPCQIGTSCVRVQLGYRIPVQGDIGTSPANC